MVISSKERKQLIDVARLYYEDNFTQAEIAKFIGVSRPTVSRMLSDAKDYGLVKIFIDDALADTGEIEHSLMENFSLQAVKVVSVTPGDEKLILQATVRESALFAARFISQDDCIGVAWGHTLFELVKNFPLLSFPNVKIVQLMGNIDSATIRSYAMEIINNISIRLGTENAYTLPCPIVVDNAIIADILLHDTKINQILNLARNCNKLFINLASPTKHSCLYQAGYLAESDIAFLKEKNSAGSIGCRYIDHMGKLCHPQLNARTIGVDLEDIIRTEMVLACVADSRKAEILHAALTGNYIDVLMVDSITANLVLNIQAKKTET